MSYLLDSNILIDYLRGDKKTAEFLYNLEETAHSIERACLKTIALPRRSPDLIEGQRRAGAQTTSFN